MRSHYHDGRDLVQDGTLRRGRDSCSRSDDAPRHSRSSWCYAQCGKACTKGSPPSASSPTPSLCSRHPKDRHGCLLRLANENPVRPSEQARMDPPKKIIPPNGKAQMEPLDLEFRPNGRARMDARAFSGRQKATIEGRIFGIGCCLELFSSFQLRDGFLPDPGEASSVTRRSAGESRRGPSH